MFETTHVSEKHPYGGPRQRTVKSQPQPDVAAMVVIGILILTAIGLAWLKVM